MDGRIESAVYAGGNHSPLERSDTATPMALTPKFVLFLLVSVVPMLAQNTAPAPTPSDTSSIILAQKPAEPSNPKPVPAPHADSASIDAAISAGVPAYDAGFSAARLNSAPPDTRGTDKPKNQIPRLPLEMMSRYVVRGARLPVFRNVDLYTKAGLIDLSFKTHTGLRVGNFFNLNSGLAYEAAMNDQRMSSRQGLVDTALAMAAGGDPTEAQAVQDSIIDESFRAATQEGPVAVGPAAH
jgi:hypothetical protein